MIRVPAHVTLLDDGVAGERNANAAREAPGCLSGACVAARHRFDSQTAASFNVFYPPSDEVNLES